MLSFIVSGLRCVPLSNCVTALLGAQWCRGGDDADPRGIETLQLQKHTGMLILLWLAFARQTFFDDL